MTVDMLDPVVGVLQDAIERGAMVWMAYRSAVGDESSRYFLPREWSQGGVFIEGFCLLRQEMRTFKVSRICEIVLITGHTLETVREISPETLGLLRKVGGVKR